MTPPARHRGESRRHGPIRDRAGGFAPPHLDLTMLGQICQGLSQEHQPRSRKAQSGQERPVEDEHRREIGVRSEVNVYLVPGRAVVTPADIQRELLVV